MGIKAGAIFTIDYEVYGDGAGDVFRDVVGPTEMLAELFRRRNKRFVLFVESLEFIRMKQGGWRREVDAVERQVRTLRDEGFEIGLHVHSQWHRASFQEGRWRVDVSEYVLPSLGTERIKEIIDDSIEALTIMLGDPGYSPKSFRSGNWLFQPSQPLASVLAARGVIVDSSVFKGGRLKSLGLDYRRSMDNGWYWRFSADINQEEEGGLLLEIPIYTKHVWIWKLVHHRGFYSGWSSQIRRRCVIKRSMCDYIRLRYPRKLDFSKMKCAELSGTIRMAIKEAKHSGCEWVPIVGIGHAKDGFDLSGLSAFLKYLDGMDIETVTLSEAAKRIGI